MIADQVREHYWSIWGPPSRSATFTTPDDRVEVYKWNADKNPEQVNLYATCGASVHAPDAYHPGHRLEFFIGLLPERDEIARVMALVALDSRLHGEQLDHGHSLTYPEPLWTGSAFHSLLVARPVENVVQTLVTGDGQGLHVEFLQVIPVYPSELRFKSEYGVEALMRLWEDKQVPFWNPDRVVEPS